MKKMWKLNNKAVSPVIATILMVAITVVLAAVLYVMVMGFGGDSGNETPTGSFTMAEKHNATHEKVIFGQITPNTNITALKIIVNSVTYNTTNGVAWTPNTLNAITYVDLANDGKISAGDYLLVDASPGANTVSMIYTETGDLVDDIDFTF